jgi:hypothetical protein
MYGTAILNLQLQGRDLEPTSPPVNYKSISAKLAPPRVIERRQIRQVRDRRQVATDLEQHAVVRLRAKILERRNLRASGPDWDFNQLGVDKRA